jgi:ketosteroid isomerase-like protein
MSEDLIAFVEAMDRCWMECRYGDLESYIASDVVMVAPGGQGRIEGLDAAADSYREFKERAQVHHYRTSGHLVTQRGDAAIVEYGWDMDWDSDGSSHSATGREVLVLSRRDGNWRVVWRTQLPGSDRAGLPAALRPVDSDRQAATLTP